MEKRLRLGQYGRQLWTRERAREIRQEIETMLQALTAGDVLTIDAEGVEVFDFSFANELFGKLVIGLATDHPGRFLVVEHLTTYTRENLAKALESMNLAMFERKGAKLDVLGKFHPVDLETYKVLAQTKEPTTAAALKDKLNISINAMNERLAKLVNLGLVRREKGVSGAGREQFEYSTIK
jgi:predicted transcriptional regulator